MILSFSAQEIEKLDQKINRFRLVTEEKQDIGIAILDQLLEIPHILRSAMPRILPVIEEGRLADAFVMCLTFQFMHDHKLDTSPSVTGDYLDAVCRHLTCSHAVLAINLIIASRGINKLITLKQIEKEHQDDKPDK